MNAEPFIMNKFTFNNHHKNFFMHYDSSVGLNDSSSHSRQGK